YHVILSLLFFFFFFFNDTATTEIYTLSLHDALPMAYLSRKALEEIGFRSIGENVKVSDKASIYNPECISIGDHSRIDDFCIISGWVSIGKYVHIAPFCLVAGGEVGVEMDDFSGLAYGVQVFSQSDDYTGASLTNPTVDDIYKLERKEKVSI